MAALSGLEYIADSPPPEHGGFHPEAVKIAKDALALIRRLRAALEQCDIVMDTAATLGLPQGLPEAYRDSWAAAHVAAREALAGAAP